VICRKQFDYLAMVLDFNIPGMSEVDITIYLKLIVHEFLEKLNEKAKCPWNENLFKINDNSKKLNVKKAKISYMYVMKRIFCCKVYKTKYATWYYVLSKTSLRHLKT
jgi:hypothetical protein